MTHDDVAVELQRRYPTLYKNVKCGITIGPGWLEIVSEISHVILHHNRNVEVLQVKEKFGGLRYYYQVRDNRGPFKQLEAAVAEAEYQSTITCEDCGKPGKLEKVGLGWLRTLCKKCYTAAQERIGV